MRRFAAAITAFLLSAAHFVSTALAQVEPAADASKEEWVMSYALVVLCIGLGVYIISKPARRER